MIGKYERRLNLDQVGIGPRYEEMLPDAPLVREYGEPVTER